MMSRSESLQKKGFSCKQRDKYKSMLLAAVAALILEEEFVNLVFAKLKLERISNAYWVAPRQANTERQKTRIIFEESTVVFSEEEFECAFRMSRRSFHVLLETLGDDLRRRNARNTVKPEAGLGTTLRLLAGSSYLDEMRHYAIEKPTVYAIFKETRVSLLRKLPFPDVLGCPDQLQRLAEKFKVSRKGEAPGLPQPLGRPRPQGAAASTVLLDCPAVADRPLRTNRLAHSRGPPPQRQGATRCEGAAAVGRRDRLASPPEPGSGSTAGRTSTPRGCRRDRPSVIERRVVGEGCRRRRR